MHSWGRASALRLSALVPPTLRGFFPIVRFGLQHNKNLLLLYTVENRGADFAICSRYLQSITLHPPVPAFPICFCSRLVEIMALSSPIDCRLYRSHSCVAHFSVSFPHYTTFPSIGTASKPCSSCAWFSDYDENDRERHGEANGAISKRAC